MNKLLLACSILFAISTNAQNRLFTKNAAISFYSKAPIEDIEAHNKAAVSVLDKTTGAVEFSVLLKGFEFEKSLMQEHFNENYVESSKYPKVVFKGKIDDLSKIDFKKDGKYTVQVTGQLTLHGQTKPVSAAVTFTIANGSVSANTEFNIAVDDYAIKIPSLVKDKIAKTIKVVVKANYQPM
jgi:polyisoprenoid-binding protein YceI